ncbi:MAG: cytochrome C [Sulfurospirillaceae bacterium]|nr:cytochrome C [Sulfurospirillaceae bacterium]
MKRLIYFISSILFGLTILSTSLHASTVKGKIFYSQNLKNLCGYSGEVMGKKYTVNEWRTIYNSNKLNEVIQVLCHKAPSIDSEKDITNLYHFLSSFASDSGNVPSCN